ncbi:hypothetical protein EJB05_40326, partial [Eragrostis curvula]
MPPKVALLEREWNDTFGHSECTDAYLDDNFTSKFGPRASARSPGSSLVPRPSAGEAVVFLEFFKYGLRIPAHPFVAEVLKAFQLEIHQLTPNAIAKLAIYIWASVGTLEEYISAGVDPLRPGWDLQFAEGLYGNGLRKYVLTSDAISVPEVEELAKDIVGPYIDKEEAGHREASILARFNRSFAARDQPYQDYGAPVPKRKRSSKATVSEEPEPSRKRHHKNAPGPTRKHLRKAALNVEPISVAPPRGSADDEGSPGDHSSEDCSSEEDPFGELPRFRISEDDEPIEFALDTDYEGHGFPSLTPSEVFPSAAVMGDVEKVLPDIVFAKERKRLSGVDSGRLFQALCANQVKAFPVFGAIKDQFFHFRNRLRHYRQRFRDTRSELREKDYEERKVSSSLFKACKDLRDCLLYLGGEVQDFPLPNASNREFAEWISANSSFAKSTAENIGVLAGAAGIEEAFAQLSLSGGSVDPILDEGFSPAEELPDPIPGEARSSFFKMAPHWQEVGSGRVSSFVEKFRESQNSMASDDATDDVPEE